MPADPVQRRLAAILAADVAGYSRLMGEDEEGTLAALTNHRVEFIEPCIAEHRGRVVKTTGDGLLVEFASVVDAVKCAAAFQEGMEDRNAATPENRRIVFRIGVNLGDVIVQDNDVFGDGVNVAARLEGLAEPGGVIVSGGVYEQVRAKVDFGFDDLGPQRIKNIAEAVHAYSIVRRAANEGLAATPAEAVLRLPSIAVLPLNNMSGEPDQDYFSDGITEDVITALSRIRSFRVVSRNSTFAYKGKAPDVRTVARELDAAYVIEGSVRRAGNRVRLTAQLIDGSTGKHLWAERYDRELDDIFALQDELTETVIGAIAPQVGKAEQQRARLKPPGRLDAWDLYQQGMWHVHKRTEEGVAKARELFQRAMELDPQFAPAYSGYARACFYNTLFGFVEDYSEPALRAAQKAVELDNGDANAHHCLGMVLYINRDYDGAIEELETAIRLEPSFAQSYHNLGTVLAHVGRARDALPYLHTAIRLSPNDDQIGPFHARLALSHLYLREHDQAVEWARKAIRLPGIQWPAHAFLVAALAHLGREEEARRALQPMIEMRPGITQSFVRDHLATSNEDDMNHLLDGLRKAGLPE